MSKKQKPPQTRAQYARAEWLPHNHYWPDRQKHALRYVIVHAVAASGMMARDVAKAYQESKVKEGPHYIIGRMGDIVQCVKEENSAWMNGVITPGADPWWTENPNLDTVSVVFVKARGDHSDAISPAQQAAGFLLIAYLCRKWRIGARWADAAGGITGHFSMDPLRYKDCPGPFPWVDLFHALNAPGDNPASSQVYMDQQQWQAARIETAQIVVPGASGAGDATATSAGQRAHQALQDAPGFAGIVGATDSAEQFSQQPIKNITDLPGWLAANGLAVLVRALLVGLGLALVGALLWSLVRRNSWVKEAGPDLIPLVLANASATGRTPPPERSEAA